MYKINRDEAKTLLKYGNVEVYGIYDDGADSLIETDEAETRIWDFDEFGVEREEDLKWLA